MKKTKKKTKIDIKAEKEIILKERQDQVLGIVICTVVSLAFLICFSSGIRMKDRGEIHNSSIATKQYLVSANDNALNKEDLIKISEEAYPEPIINPLGAYLPYQKVSNKTAIELATNNDNIELWGYFENREKGYPIGYNQFVKLAEDENNTCETLTIEPPVLIVVENRPQEQVQVNLYDNVQGVLVSGAENPEFIIIWKPETDEYFIQGPKGYFKADETFVARNFGKKSKLEDSILYSYKDRQYELYPNGSIVRVK